VHEIISKPVESVDVASIHQIKGYDAIKNGYPDYLTDESKLSAGEVELLAFPANEKELAAIVKEVMANGLTLTIAGARTGLVGGCVPAGGALISLEKMNQATHLYYAEQADEWRVSAQAGLLLSDLDTMVSEKRFPGMNGTPGSSLTDNLTRFSKDPAAYFYPPDPTEMSATIGGTVATNASGARTFRYGTTRDWVRGIRVLTVDGEILDIPRGKYFSSPGGMFVIRNASGRHTAVRIPDYTMPRTKCTAGFYAAPHMDLIDLFIGSEGAFGIITQVDVALLPREKKCAVIQFTSSDDDALRLVQALRSDPRLQLDFIEFYSENALNLLRQMQAEALRLVGMPPIPATAGAALFFDLPFDPEENNPDFRALDEAVRSAGADLRNSWAGYEPREVSRFKLFRHLLPEKVSQQIAEIKKKHPAIHRLSSDLAVPDAHLIDIWNLYRTRLNDAGIPWVGFGHVGNNHFHISAMPKDMDQLSQGMAIYSEFAKTAVSYGGSVSAEHGIGKIKAKFLPEMYSREHIDQMIAMKTAFDPLLTLNPGNIFTTC
jgi:D-lactate dehydrogenase (cytochrome)